MTKESLSRSLKNFIDQISYAPKNQHIVRKIISDSFSIAEKSAEMQLLLYVQVDNFERLLTQVRLSSIQDDAKGRYLQDIGALSAIVHHPRLYTRYDAARTEVIEPHAHVLTYANDALKVEFDLEESISTEIDQLAKLLQEVLEELPHSDLPLRIRGILYTQISQLIFLLKNFQSVGVEKVWELASASYVTVQKEASTIEAANKNGFIKRAAIGISALVGLLSAIDSGTGHAIGIAKNLENGIALIDRWRGQNRLRIEHKPSNSDETGGTSA